MFRESEKDRVNKLNACLAKILSGMKPPEDLTVSQWADKNRRLTSESSAEVGKWRTSRTPYMFDILDSFTDPLIEHIVVRCLRRRSASLKPLTTWSDTA